MVLLPPNARFAVAFLYKPVAGASGHHRASDLIPHL